jgi:hypothetical protein
MHSVVGLGKQWSLGHEVNNGSRTHLLLGK